MSKASDSGVSQPIGVAPVHSGPVCRVDGCGKPTKMGSRLCFQHNVEDRNNRARASVNTLASSSKATQSKKQIDKSKLYRKAGPTGSEYHISKGDSLHRKRKRDGHSIPSTEIVNSFPTGGGDKRTSYQKSLQGVKQSQGNGGPGQGRASPSVGSERPALGDSAPQNRTAMKSAKSKPRSTNFDKNSHR